jgi:hypothetical protein
MSKTPCIKKKFHFKTEDVRVELIVVSTKTKRKIINLHQYAGDFVGKPITILTRWKLPK